MGKNWKQRDRKLKRRKSQMPVHGRFLVEQEERKKWDRLKKRRDNG